MIAMSKAASRPTSTEAVRKRPVRAAFTSGLIASAALATALAAPAGVAYAEPAGPVVRTVAHATPLPTADTDGTGGCVATGSAGFWCPASMAATASSSKGSGTTDSTTEKKGGGTDFLDWMLQMAKSIVPGVQSVAGAVTSVANAVNPVSGVLSGIGDLFKTITGAK